MRAVLVTGATTPVGRALIRRLLGEEVEAVLAVGREPVWCGPHPDPRVHYEQVDLTRPRNLRTLLYGPAREHGVDAVVHAGTHRRAHDEGGRIHRFNVELTRELAHLCERQQDIRRFVYRSFAGVYRLGAALPDVLREDCPLEMSPSAPQWLRDRVEADLSVVTYLGSDELEVVILRCSECFAPHTGSQLWDYLDDVLCLRPMGFDPMFNLISVEDLVEALTLGLVREREGVFNVPGADTLPLSSLIGLRGRRQVALPGPLLSPLYTLRALLRGRDFRYDLNRIRFHFSGVLDGSRAGRVLGYRPRHPIELLQSSSRARSP